MHRSEETVGSLSPLNAWAFSFACMIGWAAFVMPATIFLPRGGILPSLLAFLIGTGVMCAVALNFSFLGNTYPGHGGIYSLVKIALSRSSAFIATWGLGLAYLCCICLNAKAMAMLLRTIIEEVFSFDFRIYVPQSDTLLIELAFILVELLLFAVVNVRSIRVAARLQTIGAVTLLGGIIMMFLASLLAAEQPLHAFQPLSAPDTNPAMGFMSVFLMIPWAFVGFDSISKVSQEFGFPVRKLSRIMLISVCCGGFAYIANILTTLFGVPMVYSSWQDYIVTFQDAAGAESYPIAVIASASMGRMGTVIFFLSTFSATLTGLFGFSTSLSRLIYSVSEDKLISPSLSVPHEKTGMPSRAIWLVFFLAILMSLLRDSFDIIEEVASFGTAVGFMFCSFSAMLIAFKRHKRLYVFTGAVGVVMSLCWIFFSVVRVRGFSSPLSARSVLLLAVWVFMGIALYSFSIRRSRERNLKHTG